MQVQTTKPLINKIFFGKDNALAIQVDSENCFFKWGFKSSTWQWKSVKFSDLELAGIIQVIKGEVNELSLFHTYNNVPTKLWFKKNNNVLVCKADNFTKGLNPQEQLVLETLLRHAILLLNLV